MPEVFLSLGSNHEAARHLPQALAELADTFGPLRVSGLYQAAAVGFAGPGFLNCAASFTTDRPLAEVAAALKAIETRHGRTRPEPHPDRVPLDIDLLLYGDVVQPDGPPRLPRPDILHRAYVLEPLAELAPTSLHPETGQSFEELWRRFDRHGLAQRRIDPEFPWPRRVAPRNDG